MRRCDGRRSPASEAPIRLAALALVHALIAGGAAHAAAVPADLLYGTAVGKVVTIDTVDGAITELQPLGEFAFKALTFDAGGRLFASACPLVPIGIGDLVDCATFQPPNPQLPDYPFFRPFDLLVEIDPVTGAVVEVIGLMTDGAGLPLDIRYLASPAGSTVLYGIDLWPEPGLFGSSRLWAIDPDTAEATLVTDRVPAACETYCFGTGLAAHPDGSLVHIAPDSSLTDGQRRLVTLDPETGAELTSVETPGFGDTVAVRSDGTIFTVFSFLSQHNPRTFSTRLSTIDPRTGALDEVATGVGGPFWDLAFSPLVVASVEIDVRPRPFDWINLRGRWPIAVALLGSDSVDARDVDVETLDFEGAEPLRLSVIFDVDRDDHDDLVTRFRVSETTLDLGRRQEVCLTGAFDDGQPFEGCDVVDVVSFRACGLGFELALVLPLLMARRRSRRRPARLARR